MIHRKERFQAIVEGLNSAFHGSMAFELVGSLAEKETSDHDADILVHSVLKPDLQAFAQGCLEVIAIDTSFQNYFSKQTGGSRPCASKMAGRNRY